MNQTLDRLYQLLAHVSFIAFNNNIQHDKASYRHIMETAPVLSLGGFSFDFGTQRTIFGTQRKVCYETKVELYFGE